MNQVQAAGADAGTQSSMASTVLSGLSALPVGKIIFSPLFLFPGGIPDLCISVRGGWLRCE